VPCKLLGHVIAHGKDVIDELLEEVAAFRLPIDGF
jgi:hypothetical protein